MDGQYRLQVTEQAAQSLGVKLHARAIAGISEFDQAIAAMKKAGASLVIIQPEPLLRFCIVVGSSSRPCVAVSPQSSRSPPRRGGSLEYGPDYAVLYRRAASYLDRILKGTKASPVEQPTKFEMIVNLKTATALGLTVPPSLVLGADRIIE